MLGAACFLAIYRRAFFGPVTSPVVADALDLRPRELALAAVVVLAVLAAGVYPEAVLGVIRHAAEGWAARLGAPA